MGSAPVVVQCSLTSSLGEFLGYKDWLWYPGLSSVLVSIAFPFAFHISVFSHSLFICHPRQQKFNEMNGAHLASPIRGGHGYAHWPQLGSQIHCPIGNQIWGPLGKENVCHNFVLTVGKVVFSNSGNFMAKANPPKPRSCPKRSFGQ